MVRRILSHVSGDSLISIRGRIPGVSAGGCGRVNMSLNTGDANVRVDLWTRNSRVPAARMITSASSAQKLVDSGTEAGLASAALDFGGMMNGNVGCLQ